MAIKQIDFGSKEYQQMVQLRLEVLRKPLGLIFSEADLEQEKEDILIAAYEEDKILACCILTPTAAKQLRLRQMAVLGNQQGKGLGASLMQFAETIARDKGFVKIMMHARVSAMGFYEKLGYNAVGHQFEEVTVPHFIMEKKI